MYKFNSILFYFVLIFFGSKRHPIIPIEVLLLFIYNIVLMIMLRFSWVLARVSGLVQPYPCGKVPRGMPLAHFAPEYLSSRAEPPTERRWARRADILGDSWMPASGCACVFPCRCSRPPPVLWGSNPLQSVRPLSHTHGRGCRKGKDNVRSKSAILCRG